MLVISINLFIMNPEYSHKQINQVIYNLSANERYMHVYFNEEGMSLKDLNSLKPHILVYENNDEKTIESLMEYYVNEIKRPEIKKDLVWQLQAGFTFEKKTKIIDIKKKLRKDNINGLVVHGKLEDSSWTDECAVSKYIEYQSAFNNEANSIAFHLPEVNYIIYLLITPKTSYFEVKTLLSTEIKRIFGVNVQNSTFKIFLVSKEENKEATIQQINTSLENCTSQKFIIQFQQKISLKASSHQNNTLIIIKSDQIESKMFYYDDIKDKKVIDVLSNLKEKNNWSQFGLLVTDKVLKPFQTFDKIQSICKNSAKQTKHLTAHVIKQAHMFELQLKKIFQAKKLVDFEKIIVQSELNKQHKKDCQDKMRDRAKKVNHQWFKNNFNNIKPLLLYTSELKVSGSDGKKNSIYWTINEFLRDQQFGTKNQRDYEKWQWQYKFASELMHQLVRIPKFQQAKVLWRGVSYIPKHTVGEEVLFKQFNSYSLSRMQAERFANKAIYKISNAKSCRQIRDYSYFQSQDEVLFEPYVTLKINKIQKVPNPQKGNIQITLYEAQQAEKTQLPEFKSLFILWVDDKTAEGKIMWEKLVEIQKTTIMVQLLSTEQLKKWLSKNKDMINDPLVETVMITNMTRIEKGVKVEKAGVYAVQAFRQFKPQSSIFIYIGWVEGTIAKLKQHNYVLNQKLRVSRSEHQIRKFLKEIGIK